MDQFFPVERTPRCELGLVRGFQVESPVIEVLGHRLRRRSRHPIGTAWEAEDGSIFVSVSLFGLRWKMMLHEEPL